MLEYCCFDMWTLETTGNAIRYTGNHATHTLEGALQAANLGEGRGEEHVHHGCRLREALHPGEEGIGLQTQIPAVHHDLALAWYTGRLRDLLQGGHVQSVRSYTHEINRKKWT